MECKNRSRVSLCALRCRPRDDRRHAPKWVITSFLICTCCVSRQWIINHKQDDKVPVTDRKTLGKSWELPWGGAACHNKAFPSLSLDSPDHLSDTDIFVLSAVEVFPIKITHNGWEWSRQNKLSKLISLISWYNIRVWKQTDKDKIIAMFILFFFVLYSCGNILNCWQLRFETTVSLDCDLLQGKKTYLPICQINFKVIYFVDSRFYLTLDIQHSCRLKQSLRYSQ